MEEFKDRSAGGSWKELESHPLSLPLFLLLCTSALLFSLWIFLLLKQMMEFGLTDSLSLYLVEAVQWPYSKFLVETF